MDNQDNFLESVLFFINFWTKWKVKEKIEDILPDYLKKGI